MRVVHHLPSPPPSGVPSVAKNRRVFDGLNYPEAVAALSGGWGHLVSGAQSHPWSSVVLVLVALVEPSSVASSSLPCVVSFSSPSLASTSAVVLPFVLGLLLQTCAAVVAGASNRLQQLPLSLCLRWPLPLGGGHGHSVDVAYRSLELEGKVGSLPAHQVPFQAHRVPFRLLLLPLSAAFAGAWQACVDGT